MLRASANAKSKTRTLLWTAFGLVLLIAALLVAKWILTPVYPYGGSHSCSKILGSSLRMYADDHGGWLPHGGRTPEESMSFMATNGDPYFVKALLRGKHLPQSVVDAAFVTHGVLSPASCGWHYVEGLRKGDDPALAVAWDKMSGLNHNGRLMKNVEREVILLDGSAQQISKTEWPKFCTHQKRLLAEAEAKRKPGDPPIRWSDEAALGPNHVLPPVWRHASPGL